MTGHKDVWIQNVCCIPDCKIHKIAIKLLETDYLELVEDVLRLCNNYQVRVGGNF